MIDTFVNPNGHGLKLSYYGAPNDTKPNTYSGYIQPPLSGWYTIQSNITYAKLSPSIPASGYGYALSLPEVIASDPSASGGSSQITTSTVYLLAGKKYIINVYAWSGSYFTGTLNLSWKNSSCNGWSSFNSVATTNLDTISNLGTSVQYNTSYCNTFTGLRSDSSTVNPSPSFTQGTKYWFSCWVKEEQDCLCQNYTNNQVSFVFTDANNNKTTIITKAKGNIIEGWQRFDTTFDIPVNAVKMTVKLQSTGNTNVYFDDIRLHPYNANMQTFVYNPVNLRLMAQLDENNYATFYEYDDDGTLIRVKKETARGIQTIKETRSYLVR
jgi:hypothetical protein